MGFVYDLLPFGLSIALQISSCAQRVDAREAFVSFAALSE
jgi:hypothetical protein